jgi:hypothetical protein
MVYSCQITTYEAGRDAAERQTCASVANSVANRRLRLVQTKVSSIGNARNTPSAIEKGRQGLYLTIRLIGLLSVMLILSNRQGAR